MWEQREKKKKTDFTVGTVKSALRCTTEILNTENKKTKNDEGDRGAKRLNSSFAKIIGRSFVFAAHVDDVARLGFWGRITLRTNMNKYSFHDE